MAETKRDPRAGRLDRDGAGTGVVDAATARRMEQAARKLPGYSRALAWATGEADLNRGD